MVDKLRMSRRGLIEFLALGAGLVSQASTGRAQIMNGNSVEKRDPASLIGHRTLPGGPTTAIVMNDWLADTGTWAACEAYLDRQRVSWLFADLRGYGRSRYFSGPYSADQAVADMVALANYAGADKFVIIGHSMSSIAALRMAQLHPDRLLRAILITPPPVVGGAPPEVVAQAKAMALASDDERLAALRMMWGDRLSDAWIAAKAAQWRASSVPGAVAAYTEMFMTEGLRDRDHAIDIPVIAVTGEGDPNEMMRSGPVRAALAPICRSLEIIPLHDSGHYPMQEVPPLFATLIERIAAGSTPAGR